MKSRISSMVGEDNARNIWMGTFHSIFARILRIEHEKIGYPSILLSTIRKTLKASLKLLLKKKN